MARGVDVARFNREVDTLADDTARLEARLNQMQARLPETAGS
jgi:ubiquinone biosynthesis protein UbiJ